MHRKTPDMPWLEWEFPFAFSSEFSNKRPNKLSAYLRGFQHVRENILYLCEVVSAGYAFAPQCDCDQRKAKFFLCAGYIAVDVDHGPRLDQALDDPFIRRCATIIYTTANHTEEHHRYRIVFALEKPSTNAEEHALLLNHIAQLVGGDLAAVDAARMSYGNDAAEFFYVNGGIDCELTAYLLEQAQTLRVISRSRPTVGAQVLPEDLVVQPKCGPPTMVADLPDGTSVHCPWHTDAHPSAFVLMNSKKTAVGIHCMSCKQTGWMKPRPPFDFYDFETMVLEAHARKQSNYQS